MVEQDYKITIPIGNRIYPKACLGCSEDMDLMTARLPFLGYVNELQGNFERFHRRKGFPYDLGLD